jgi:Mg-chelatase subunit ChlD
MPNRCRFTCTLPLSLLLAATASAQDAGSNFGHARVRELAALGHLPSTRDVVVRDVVNYHRHRLPLPNARQAVALDVRFDRADVRPGDEVWLQVGYTTAPQGDRALAPASAVALVVDCSGSMQDAGKMTHVQAGLRAFADRLRADDEVAIVTFSTAARVDAPRRRAGDRRWLHDAIGRLRPDGSTNLHAGLMLGIEQLSGSECRSRRVVLLTDGIANVGVTAPSDIVADATRRAGTSIDIATIGVGQNLDTVLLQRLAEGCRGLFHFVADGADIQKVFVHEADALLAAVARQVRLRVDLLDQLEIVQVYGEGARVLAGRVEQALPDLNAGATGVLMLRCRLRAGAFRESVRAEMLFTAAATGEATSSLVQSAMERTHPTAAGLDVEVRKNAAIAVLAQGLADMAAACDSQRWADGDRALLRATDEAQRLFPGNDDDVRRVRDIVAGHTTTLRRYVDRFRDY